MGKRNRPPFARLVRPICLTLNELFLYTAKQGIKGLAAPLPCTPNPRRSSSVSLRGNLRSFKLPSQECPPAPADRAEPCFSVALPCFSVSMGRGIQPRSAGKSRNKWQRERLAK